MMLARYIGSKPRVKVGLRFVKPGQLVGEPGQHGADVTGPPGIVAFLLDRVDFQAVPEVIPKPKTRGQPNGKRTKTRPIARA